VLSASRSPTDPTQSDTSDTRRNSVGCSADRRGPARALPRREPRDYAQETTSYFQAPQEVHSFHVVQSTQCRAPALLDQLTHVRTLNRLFRRQGAPKELRRVPLAEGPGREGWIWLQTLENRVLRV
jgi:hypothetical protein